MDKHPEIRIKRTDKTSNLIDWLDKEAERQHRSLSNLVFMLLSKEMELEQ